MPIIAIASESYPITAYGKCNTEFFGFPGTRVIDMIDEINNDLGEPPRENYVWASAIWCAVANTQLTSMPTQYQGALPKYQIGFWAQVNTGIVVADGFLNYQIQRICGGACSLNTGVFTYYNGTEYPVPPTQSGPTGIVQIPQAFFGNTTDTALLLSDGFYISGNSNAEGTLDLYYYALANEFNEEYNPYQLYIL